MCTTGDGSLWYTLEQSPMFEARFLFVKHVPYGTF